MGSFYISVGCLEICFRYVTMSFGWHICYWTLTVSWVESQWLSLFESRLESNRSVFMKCSHNSQILYSLFVVPYYDVLWYYFASFVTATIKGRDKLWPEKTNCWWAEAHHLHKVHLFCLSQIRPLIHRKLRWSSTIAVNIPCLTGRWNGSHEF